MRVELGEAQQARMFPACVVRDSALHGGRIVLVGWILVVSPQRLGACPRAWLRAAVCVLELLKMRCVRSGWRKGKGSLLGKAGSLDAAEPLH